MNVTVYLSSRADIDERFRNAVSVLGQGIGEMKARLIYGGSDAGQMHVLAETAKRNGATITGIIPEIFRRLADPIADEMVYTLDLSERKTRMFELGQVFVALPGGIGTLDEVMSTLAFMTVHANFSRKIILVNIIDPPKLFSARITQPIGWVFLAPFQFSTTFWTFHNLSSLSLQKSLH